MNKSESIAEIAKALAAFQKQVVQPEKSAKNPFFKSNYVPIEEVVKTINEFGPPNGLSFTQWPVTGEVFVTTSTDKNGKETTTETRPTGVATLLMHEGGEFIEYDPFFAKSDKDTAQGAGSVITYLRRYALSAAYGLTSDEDDDGNNATGNGATNNKTQTKTDDF